MAEAANYLRKALSQAEEIGISRITARSLSGMARLELHRGDLLKAAQYSREAVDIVTEQPCTIVEEIHFTHFVVLSEMGKEAEVFASLKLAAETVYSKADALRVKSTRSRFLASYKPITDAWFGIENDQDG